MRITPLWAKRSTTCYHCRDIITPGSRRISSLEKTQHGFLRKHLHLACFMVIIASWYDNNPMQQTGGHGGRHPLGLSPDHKRARQKLVQQLWYLRNSTKDILLIVERCKTLNLPVDKELSPREFDRYIRYTDKKHKVHMQLQDLGGIPVKYL